MQMDFSSASVDVVVDELDAHAGLESAFSGDRMNTNYSAYLQDAYAARPASYYLGFVKTPVESGQSVLDWGCGLGGLLLALEGNCPGLKLSGADVLDDTLARIREAKPDWDLRKIDVAASQLPWEAGRFDRIFLLDVIEHVPDPVALLAEARRLLKTGGILTISTPDRWAFYKKPGKGLAGNIGFNLRRIFGLEWVDPTHLTEYTTWSLARLLSRSAFGASGFRPSAWHWIPWARPPKRHFSFVVELQGVRE